MKKKTKYPKIEIWSNKKLLRYIKKHKCKTLEEIKEQLRIK